MSDEVVVVVVRGRGRINFFAKPSSNGIDFAVNVFANDSGIEAECT